MAVRLDYQQTPTSRGHYVTATTVDGLYDGQGPDVQTALLDLIANMKDALDTMAGHLRTLETSRVMEGQG